MPALRGGLRHCAPLAAVLAATPPAFSWCAPKKQALVAIDSSAPKSALVANAVAPPAEHHAPPKHHAPLEPSGFNQSMRVYSSRQQCFDDLGVGKRCKSHCARVVKTQGQLTHLRCHLRGSDPQCAWAAIAKTAHDGTVELLQHPACWTEHNEESAPKGTRGFENMGERKAMETLLESQATAKPSTALRTARLHAEKPVQNVQLQQVQKLKKMLVPKRFACQNLGDIRKEVAARESLPADRTKGYFCFSHISKIGEKPYVIVVATSRELQERWAASSECPAAIDGGYKFNLLGWPLHVLGSVNPAGKFGVAALAITSNVELDTVSKMLIGFKTSTERVTRRTADRLLAMSDGEVAYRNAMAKTFGSANLMCFFHVKQAARDNLMKRFEGNLASKKNTWKQISEDIDLMRGAHCKRDFVSRRRTHSHGICMIYHV